MSRSLTDDQLRELYARESAYSVVALVKISHSDITTIRISNSREDIYDGEYTWSAYPFNAVLPPDTDSRRDGVQIKASGVDRTTLQAIRSIDASDEDIEIELSVVSTVDPGDPIIGPLSLLVRAISATATDLTIDCRYEDVYSEPVPGHVFSIGYFPGIAQ